MFTELVEQMVAKKYPGETNTRVYLALDVSRSMGYRSGALTKLEYGSLLAASLAYFSLRQRDAAGLVWGIQTLRQLVAANQRGRALPCLQIRDWPALRYRGFHDDITRGRSSLLMTLEREVGLSEALKLNFFSYYLEHQYAFAKHPDIGPPDGSLRPAELQRLVQYAARRSVEIFGCQQSFGHFGAILAKPAYAALREGSDCLNPTTEGTYRLEGRDVSELSGFQLAAIRNQKVGFVFQNPEHQIFADTVFEVDYVKAYDDAAEVFAKLCAHNPAIRICIEYKKNDPMARCIFGTAGETAAFCLMAGAPNLGATLDLLIPPSIAMVIYGIATQTSIGKLLIAGVIPGIIVGIFLAFLFVEWLFDYALKINFRIVTAALKTC
jgi:hypothetical protein